jgi:hypothetical protein
MLTELDWLLGLTAARARWRHSRQERHATPNQARHTAKMRVPA